ncbi:MAG: DUF2339 domain-containing protein [Aliishimia sp.]
MDGIVILIVLALAAIPISIIYLLFVAFGLKRRVAESEKQIALLEVSQSDSQRMIQALRRGEPIPEPVPEPALEPVKTPGPIPASASEPAVQATLPKVERAASESTAPDIDGATNPETVTPEDPPAVVVMTPSMFSVFFTWLAENWFYVVSAISLALAGVFLVDYGMQNGLLPPRARVAASMGFGLILIGAGEWIRRRWGDETDGATAYLPSVFSGAGIVTLFGGLLAARVLYDLIGAETALIGMIAVAILAMILGWFHGPLLAGVGILGAYGAPFVVGGSSDDPSWLFGYFTVIAALGLGIDTVRRWAWVSVLTLVCAFVAGPLIVVGEPNAVWAFVLYLTALVAFSILVPARGLKPDQSGAMIAEMIRARGKPWPEFPTRLAFGAVLVSTGWLVLAANSGRVEFWMATLALAALAAALTVWSRTGPALQDITVIPVAGFAASVFIQGMTRDGVWRDFARAYEGNPEASYPWAVTALVALALVVSALAAWRSLQPGRYGLLWAAGAAFFAPATAVMVELTWAPMDAIGAYVWALHGAALAILATVLAGLYARIDGPESRLRTSLAALAAVATMSFALVIVLDDDALTLALVATVVFAAALDRRFNLPAMTLFVTMGVVAIGYRLVVGAELGLVAFRPWLSLIAVYAGAILGFVASIWLLRPRARIAAQVMLETGLWSALGLTFSLILYKFIDAVAKRSEDSHWVIGLYAVIWLVLMCVQLKRQDLGGWMRYLRLALASVFALIGFGAVFLSISILNPLIGNFGGRVLGPPLVNTLAVAYMLPALVLAAAAWKIPTLPTWLSRAFYGIAGLLTALWAFATIRHVWQGSGAMPLDRGMGQPELYTYTVVILLLGAGLFYQSLAKNHAMMRKAGLVVIGIAVAKVFFVDISGLQGLTRVFSLLVLGLSLAALAWLNRWAQGRVAQDPPES